MLACHVLDIFARNCQNICPRQLYLNIHTSSIFLSVCFSLSLSLSLYIYIYIYIYIYTPCLSVCVCVDREREREIFFIDWFFIHLFIHLHSQHISYYFFKLKKKPKTTIGHGRGSISHWQLIRWNCTCSMDIHWSLSCLLLYTSQ